MARERVLRRVCALSGCPVESNVRKPGHIFWGKLLTFQCIVQWDAVSFPYQCTGPTTSHRHAQTRGVEIMRVALEETAK